MSTFVDYKNQRLIRAISRKASGVATDDINAVGLVYPVRILLKDDVWGFTSPTYKLARPRHFP